VGRKTGTHDGGWGWGAKFADFDNDGLLDIVEANGFVTGPDPERTYWYALQEMVTQLKNITSDAADWPPMGDRDLSGHEENRLWLQRPSRGGDLVFEEVAKRAGITDRLNGRGVAVLDADDDGDLDILIANQGAKACYYKNLLYEPGHRAPARWLGLALVGDPGAPAASEERGSGADGASEVRSRGADGDSEAGRGEAARGDAGIAARRDESGRSASGGAAGQGEAGRGEVRQDDAGRSAPGSAAARRLASTRDALGACAVLRAGGRSQTRVVSSAMGFAAQSDPRLFFGLSDPGEPESLEITWPSGRVQRFGEGELHAFVNRMTRIVEGRTPEATP
jgi:hypothetical protein